MATPQHSWQQVTELFEQALELTPDARGEFLKSACGSNLDLLREVESLLAEHEAEAGFLESPAVAAIADQLAQDGEHLPIGKQLGQYRIEARLGRGGMGEVYLAQDKLGRKVALKLLTQRFPGDKSGIPRFQQEARTLLALNHPHIMTIHDIDQIEGVYCIAGELVEGETLRRRLDENELGLEDVLEIAIQVATALSAAHEKGIVHRDIKPENIMIRRDGFVKVLDFGIAKLSEKYPTGESEATTLKQAHTAEGAVVGTAPYMSPEQARGLKVDARTDIWSLGVVIYEAVAGRKPFSGATTADIISSVIDKTPAPLSRYASEVPEELEWIVSRALRKEKEGRYQTANELVTDLKQLRTKIEIAKASGELMGRPALFRATPVGETRKTAEPAASTSLSSAEYITTEIKRHKIAFALGLLVLVAGVVGLSIYLKSAKTSVAADPAIQSLAVLPFKNESGNPDMDYLSDGMTETLINNLSQLSNLSVKARSSVFRYKENVVEPQTVASELSVQAILTGRVVQRGDGLTLYLSLVDGRNGNQLWGQRYDRKLTDLVTLQNEIGLDVSRKLRAQLTGADEQKVAKNYTDNVEAYQFYLKGRYHWYKSTPEDSAKAREYFQQAIDVDPSYALAYSGLADVYGRAAALGQMRPEVGWPRHIAAVRKALELDPNIAEIHNSLAGLKLSYYRDFPGAETEFKRAIELDPNYVEARAHYGGYLVLVGRVDEAIAQSKRAQELDPLSPGISRRFGFTLFHARRYDEAIQQFLKAIELNPGYALAHEDLGNAYEQKKMYGEAVAAWQKALTLSRNDELAATLDRAYKESGYEGAVRAASRKKLEQLRDKARREEFVPAMDFVRLYVRLGDKDQAFAWLEKAYEERTRLIFAIKIDPLFDGLRTDPRFADLLRRLNLN